MAKQSFIDTLLNLHTTNRSALYSSADITDKILFMSTPVPTNKVVRHRWQRLHLRYKIVSYDSSNISIWEEEVRIQLVNVCWQLKISMKCYVVCTLNIIMWGSWDYINACLNNITGSRRKPAIFSYRDVKNVICENPKNQLNPSSWNQFLPLGSYLDVRLT